jgi:enoyl-CoA hydratase/carnithine racemase
VRRIGIVQLAESAASAEEFPVDLQLLVVELDGVEAIDDHAVRRCADAVRSTVAVAVGLAVNDPVPPELAAAFDLILASPPSPDARERVVVEDVEGVVTAISQAITAAPAAAYVTVSLARQAEALEVRDALIAESAAYSLLLNGDEFKRWLDRRGPPRPATRADGGQRVRLARHGNDLDVVLQRPARRNAVDARMRDELCAALRLPLADPTIASVTLSGDGPTFSSGGDLDEFGSFTDAIEAHAVRLTRSVAWAIHRVRERVTTRLHGPCCGAGVELASFAGRVSATADTTLRLPELALGLVPGAGGTVGITRRAGRARFNWLALTGTEIEVETALRWNLVDELE